MNFGFHYKIALTTIRCNLPTAVCNQGYRVYGGVIMISITGIITLPSVVIVVLSVKGTVPSERRELKVTDTKPDKNK